MLMPNVKEDNAYRKGIKAIFEDYSEQNQARDFPVKAMYYVNLLKQISYEVSALI